MKYILSVIAVCLVLITAKLYIPEANAEVARMDHYELRRDIDFKKAVRYLVENDTDIETSIEKIILEEIKRNYRVKDEIEKIIIEGVKSDYYVKGAVKDLVEDCNIFISGLTMESSTYENIRCL